MAHCPTLIQLGSNLPDRQQWLETARLEIATYVGTIVEASAVYVSAPWGNPNQSPFLNQVVEIVFQGTPIALLHKLQAIEKKMGRQQTTRWGPRIIDLDILFAGDAIVDKVKLTIPHPGIPDRRFVLIPLVEKWAACVHPRLRKTNRQLLHECNDLLEVEAYRPLQSLG